MANLFCHVARARQHHNYLLMLSLPFGANYHELSVSTVPSLGAPPCDFFGMLGFYFCPKATIRKACSPLHRYLRVLIMECHALGVTLLWEWRTMPQVVEGRESGKACCPTALCAYHVLGIVLVLLGVGALHDLRLVQ